MNSVAHIQPHSSAQSISSHRWSLLAALLVLLLIFVVDILTPLELVVAPCYLIAVWIISRTLQPSWIWGISIVCTLTCLSVLLVKLHAWDILAVLNRVIVIALIWHLAYQALKLAKHQMMPGNIQTSQETQLKQLLDIAFGATLATPTSLNDPTASINHTLIASATPPPGSSDPFEESLQFFAQQVRIVIGAHQSAVSYIPQGNFEKAIHAVSLSKKYEQYLSYDVKPSGAGIWYEIIKNRKPLRMTQAELISNPHWKNFSKLKDDRGLEHPPMRGWLAVPFLSLDADFVGMVQLTDKYEGDFNDEDMELLIRLTKLMTPAYTLRYANQQISLKVEQATQELSQAYEDLELKNRELEEFAYVASHDLRTPLTGIKNLATWILEDNNEVLPQESKRHLNQMQQRIDRLDQLLTSLLQYSRAGRVHGEYVEVDMNELLQETVEVLQIPEGFNVRSLTSLPTFTTFRTPLAQVIRNLINNAIKHHDQKSGTIEFKCQDIGDAFQFSVKDDGPGIPQEFQEQIFKMFETLKPRDQVEGSGMGLAMIKKIVMSYGGEVCIYSLGRGAEFTFTWPKFISVR